MAPFFTCCSLSDSFTGEFAWKIFKELTSHLSRHSPDNTWNCPRWVTFLFMSQFIWTEELLFFFLLLLAIEYMNIHIKHVGCIINSCSILYLLKPCRWLVKPSFSLTWRPLDWVRLTLDLFAYFISHSVINYIKQDIFYEALHCQCYHGHLFYNVGLKYAFILA